MIVVSDTGPINYLVIIGRVSVLAKLFSSVVIPRSVYDELCHEDTPFAVREWVTALPEWAVVRRASSLDPALSLDAGEREAIALAESLRADALLLDDRKARRAAKARGLGVTGTLGILKEAHKRGLLDLSECLEQLKHTSFRADPELMRSIMDE